MPEPDGSWAALPQRIAWARALRRTIARRHAELTALASEEIGKPPFECFAAEVIPLLRATRLAEKRIARLTRPRRLAGGGLFSLGIAPQVRRIPLGRIGIIATWNYPIGLLGVQAMHALIAGNRIIVKPSERSPRTQQLLLNILAAPDNTPPLPPGVLDTLDATREAGQRLIDLASSPDPTLRLDHIVFTGSTEVGRTIAQRLAESLTPSTLELSGRDSAIVLDDADPELAAGAIWAAVRLNAGQTCMAPRRAIVCPRAYPAFIAAIERLALATPAARLIAATERDKAARDLPAASAGPRIIPAPAAAADPGTMPVTAVLDCPPDAPIAAGRHFGPVLAVIPARDEAHALAIHAASDQRLATAIFTTNPRRARRDLAPRLGSTIVTINDAVVPTGHPDISIGGIGQSGWGLSRGTEGLLAMTRPVWITTTHPRLRTPTRLLEGRAADRFMAFASRVLGR